MKKILLSLLAVMISFTALAQTKGDKLTINLKNGTSQVWDLTADGQAPVSKITHTADGKVGFVMTGMEDFGAFETYDINDINNISFSIYHESEVGNVNLADPSATEKTKRLYKYLQLNYGSKTISSVIANVNWNTQEADKIYQATGKYPAINCYDFIHIYVPKQGSNGWINYNDITPVTNWADKGGLVSLMWHFKVPKTESTVPGTDGSGVTCTPTETTFKAANALTAGTWENKWFYQEMDKVVEVLQKLQDAGVVAIWRPFHEAAGNACLKSGASWGKSWFWWGYDGAETYKKLWQTMFDYFQSKGIHNLIWAWTTQNCNGDANTYNNDADWYPGDKYVDIIGRDLYGYDAAKQAQEFKEIQARYPGKLIALAECGTDANSNTTTAGIDEAWYAGAKWSFFMPWYGSNMPSNDWWKAAMNSKNVITRDQVNLNANYVEESAVDAVKNMGIGTNFGNCTDVVAMWMNMNSNSVTDFEKAWGQVPTTKPMVDFLKQNGFNSVRIPVTWFQHMKADGTVDEAWMNRIQEIVDYIIDNGMYCILNVHHDTGADPDDKSYTHWIKADVDNYNTNKEKFEYLWTQIATRFKNYDHHLVFEGYNEMLDANNTWNAPKDASSYKGLNGYAQSFVNAVRATGGNNATRNLIVNTYAAACGNDVLNNLTIPTDKVEGHIAVEVHTYSPWDWFAKGKWDASCSKEIADMFTRLNSKFISKGIPCIIGEYGTHGTKSVSKNSSASEIQAAADQAADIVKQAKAYGVATFYWTSIFSEKDRTVPQWTLPTVVEAMKKAYNE